MGAFLVKLLNDLLVVGKVFVGIAPVVGAVTAGTPAASLVTKGANDFEALINLIITAETAWSQSKTTPLTQEQKLQFLAPIAGDILSTSNSIAGKQLGDPAAFDNGVNLALQAAYSFVASFHENTASQVVVQAIQS